MEPDIEAGLWATELESLLLRVGQRFGRIEPRRRMRDYVRGLLGPVGRNNSWQLAEHATPYGLQRLLSWCQWDPDEIRDDLQATRARILAWERLTACWPVDRISHRPRGDDLHIHPVLLVLAAKPPGPPRPQRIRTPTPHR